MTTNNSVNTSLSGQTGTGSFVGSNSPALITPNLGIASATSLTFSSTSGIIGTTTNNNAAAGSVGEYISSQVLFANAISITSGTNANVTSISLTAGDWDVSGNIFIDSLSGLATLTVGAISTVSATLPDTSMISDIALTGGATISGAGMAIFTQRFSFSITTTVYLVALASFTGSGNASGIISARRVR